MDSAIFKSDIEIKYPPQNKWPFKKKNQRSYNKIGTKNDQNKKLS